jgi:hypothetical protein
MLGTPVIAEVRGDGVGHRLGECVRGQVRRAQPARPGGGGVPQGEGAADGRLHAPALVPDVQTAPDAAVQPERAKHAEVKLADREFDGAVDLQVVPGTQPGVEVQGEPQPRQHLVRDAEADQARFHLRAQRALHAEEDQPAADRHVRVAALLAGAVVGGDGQERAGTRPLALDHEEPFPDQHQAVHRALHRHAALGVHADLAARAQAEELQLTADRVAGAEGDRADLHGLRRGVRLGVQAHLDRRTGIGPAQAVVARWGGGPVGQLPESARLDHDE